MAQNLRVHAVLEKREIRIVVRLGWKVITGDRQGCRALNAFYRVWTWPYLHGAQCSQRELVTPQSQTRVNLNMFNSKLVVLPLFQWYASHSNFVFRCP